MLEPLLTADEVGRLLSMSRIAVYTAAQRGLLPGVVRIGRRLRFRSSDIRRLIETGTIHPGSAPARKPK